MSVVPFQFSKRAKNIITLISGTTLGQLLPIAITPLLTRVFSPQEFGQLALLLSIVSIFSVIVCGRYEVAIVIAASRLEALRLCKLAMGICLAIITLFTTLWTFLSPLVYYFSNGFIDFAFLPLITGGILFLGINQIFTFWLNRYKAYKQISFNKVMHGVTLAISQVYVCFFNPSVWSLMFCWVLAQFLSCIHLFILARQNGFYLSKTAKLKKALIKYKKMPLINAPHALVDTVRVNGINALISLSFSSALLGQFSLAWRLLQAPLSLINAAINKVYFQELSQVPQGKIGSSIKYAIKRSAIIGVLPFSLIFFLSPSLFPIIFGPEWDISGVVATILTPWLYMNFITNPISTSFIIMKKQGIAFTFAIFYMLIPLSILYFSTWEFILTIKLLSFAMTTLLLGYIVIVLKTASTYDLKT